MANITYIRIDDEVYALHDDNALTSDSSLDASKVVGTLPANTYTDTTYENKAAVQGGTDVSLVTTGDKYRWNNASSGGVSDVEVNGSSVVSGGIAEITVPTKTSDLTNDSNFQNATQVDTAINTRIASVYKAKGSIAFLDLPTLTSSNEGFVYDVNESFTTTSDFVEGAGVTYPAGTNVVIIDVGSGVYKYDVLAGLVDLSGKQDTLVSGTNIKTINSQSILGSGNLTISGGLQNLVDGSTTGSVKGVGAKPESSTYTIGLYAFAEGYGTRANGGGSHAEGTDTTASGSSSHAEGIDATASGMSSHAEGNNTTASGGYSHAQNYGTIAAKTAQTTLGTYNIEDTSTTTTHPSETTSYGQYAVIVGNGTNSQRSNALTVDWSGNTDQQGRATTKDLTTTEIDALISELGLHGRTICPYDVGDIYITRNSTNPATKWQGTTWRQIKDTFLLAAGDNYTAGDTGGEAEVTLTQGQLPNIRGTISPLAWKENEGAGVFSKRTSTFNLKNASSGTANSFGVQYYDLSIGNDEPHENMPPYLVVYAWERLS